MIFRVILIAFLGLYGSVSMAQFQTLRSGSILILDQPSLLTRSKLGQAILSLEQSEQAAILEAGHQVTQQLENEEADLTQQRATLTPDEFRVLADAFNDKAEAARASQNAIDAAQLARVENRRRAFFQFIGPQLAEMMQRFGASAIFERRSVLLFDKNLDITQETIALLDAAYEENPDMIDLGN